MSANWETFVVGFAKKSPNTGGRAVAGRDSLIFLCVKRERAGEDVPFCATALPAVTFTGGVPDGWVKDTSSSV